MSVRSFGFGTRSAAIWWAVSSVAIFLMLTSSGRPQVPQADESVGFLQFIDDIGFGSLPGNASKRYVLKRSRPLAVQFYFAERTSPQIVTSISTALSDASRASGMSAQFYRDNYNVMFLAADWHAGGLEEAIDTISQFFESKDQAVAFIAKRKLNTNKCALKLLLDKEEVIQGGLLLIDVGGSDLRSVEHCSVRSVASLFGLATLNVVDDNAYPSITNTKLNAVGLSDYDKRFLQLLYDPSIRSGMTDGEAMPRFRSLVRSSSAR